MAEFWTYTSEVTVLNERYGHMTGVSIQDKKPIFPSCLRLGVEVKVL